MSELNLAPVLLLLIGAIFVIFLAPLRLRSGGEEKATPYECLDALFTPAERSFLGVLEQAVGSDYRVYGKVRVADVVGVKPTDDRKAWRAAFNRISSKHFDFVICRKNDLGVVAVIELDDRSHGKRSRRVRDAFLIGLCRDIALPLISVPAQRAYSVAALQEQLREAIEPLAYSSFAESDVQVQR